jgi:hypothetical protein
MDPQPLTTDQWAQVGLTLKMLWLALACALVSGPSFLAAHAIIPSAVDTKTISNKWSKFRGPLYLVGLASLIGIFVFLGLAFLQLDFIWDTYSRWWQ